MNIDFDYLATMPAVHPRASSIRWGCSFDGRQMALVGYVTEPNGDYSRGKRPMELIAEENAVVFYSTLLPGCTITRAVKVLDSIAGAIGIKGLTLYVEGALGRNEVFIRHINRETAHTVKLFKENQGRWYDQVEVIAGIADDQETGRIVVSPEFTERPEKVLLDEATGVIEEEKRMNPLQSAFVYGLGYWSCKERRKKYQMGQGPAFW